MVRVMWLIMQPCAIQTAMVLAGSNLEDMRTGGTSNMSPLSSSSLHRVLLQGIKASGIAAYYSSRSVLEVA